MLYLFSQNIHSIVVPQSDCSSQSISFIGSIRHVFCLLPLWEPQIWSSGLQETSEFFPSNCLTGSEPIQISSAFTLLIGNDGDDTSTSNRRHPSSSTNFKWRTIPILESDRHGEVKLLQSQVSVYSGLSIFSLWQSSSCQYLTNLVMMWLVSSKNWQGLNLVDRGDSPAGRTSSPLSMM